jgi:hypothetical protein
LHRQGDSPGEGGYFEAILDFLRWSSGLWQQEGGNPVLKLLVPIEEDLEQEVAAVGSKTEI